MRDGQAFGEQIVAIVKGYLGRSLQPLLDRLAALEDAPAAPSEAAIRAVVAQAIEEHRTTLEFPGPLTAAMVETVQAAVRDAVAALPPPKDGTDGAPGAPGERGLDGAPGQLPLVRGWCDEVHYQADVVSHGGSTWQALRDTGHAPPHEDWQLLAGAGADGRSFYPRGTWAESQDYLRFDVVALNGASFVALRDQPGACPGEGWQLLAQQGRTGRPGERGLPGPRGEPGPAVIAAEIDGRGLLTLTNGDGTIVTCDLYPLLSRLG